ncbi:DUF4259 domain-containing protein [Kitasatospora sp. NA04385]|uniref:DUF4259 domain-containing protein n=1 Tax=Kitasatospora sp. NA04385 TaxID=2742135 RepID=UPI001590386E|nr:DUF4259 domain-containing protein [Kitasatospora sp. NA04385]QKW20607.1 DUF4259 domain-containing protein [Kitasatospora sp. NA04385]
MGTWDIGAFDSDHAGEFGTEVGNARPGRRGAVIEERLMRFNAAPEPDYYLRDEAIAAAALVAAQCPGGPDGSAPYWPRVKIPQLPAHLRPLAATALDKVLAGVQDDMELWCRTGNREKGEQWLEGIEDLRRVLDPHTPHTVAYTPAPPLPTEVGTLAVHRALGVDRIRALSGAGSSGPLGSLVRQLGRAALRLDAAHKSVQTAVEHTVQELDGVRQRLQDAAADSEGEFHPRDVPSFAVPAALAAAMAQRAERHRHLQDLIGLYRELSAPHPAAGRAAAARASTRTSSRTAPSPAAQTVLPVPASDTARRH